METAVVIIIGLVIIIILLVLSPKVQKDIDKMHPKQTETTEHLTITCAEFLKVLEENPEKELEITVKTYVGGEFGGYFQKDTKKVTDIEVSDDKVKITYS